MSLRLLRLLVPEDMQQRALEIMDEHEVSPRWCVSLEQGRVMVEAVVSAEGNEPVLDDLEEALGDTDGFRILFTALQATVPRVTEEEADEDARNRKEEKQGKAPQKGERSRINREELYASLRDSSETTPYYLVMVALSSVVACAGLLLGDGAVIIGAMVIAPLIGPWIALALATTLGDLVLGRRALLSSGVGMLAAFVVALAAGVLVEVDPTGAEIEGRTRLTFEHLALALAAGAAGAMAMAKGVATGLVGVMVAVALLPPLANGGLLLGGGHLQLGYGALVLVLGNVVCVNLAAIVTFLVQGLHPRTWEGEDHRRRALWTASVLWGVLLLTLLLVVWLGWSGEAPG